MIKHNKSQSKNKHQIAPLDIPIQKLFPNIITIISLCLGISSIRYALDFKMHISAGLIMIAAFMDGVDGRLARLLNSSSSFGAQLDSLSDIVSFGVAPAVVIYIWSLNEIPYKGVGWAIVLLFVICSALRLARFHVQTNDKKGALKAQHYFTGVPMPAAAGIALLPLISTFELLSIKFSPWFIACYMLVISFLMVSNVPTFSFKKVNIHRKYITLLLLLAAILIVGVILEPWIVLPILGLVYISLIPASIYHYLKVFKKVNSV